MEIDLVAISQKNDLNHPHGRIRLGRALSDSVKRKVCRRWFVQHVNVVSTGLHSLQFHPGD